MGSLEEQEEGLGEEVEELKVEKEETKKSDQKG